MSDVCYGNVLSALQLSADVVFNWATNNFMTILPKKKIHYQNGKLIKEFHDLMNLLQKVNNPLNVSVTLNF